MNNINGENISDALDMLDNDIIEEAEKLRSGSAAFKPKHRYVKWASLAACLCLIMTGAFVWFLGVNRQGGIPFEEDPIDDVKVSASLIPAFKYKGELYQGQGFINIPSIAGEKLGTAKWAESNYINEWGDEDFTGTVQGTVYEVKGYDPSFMLCTKDGIYVEIFIRKTGWELKMGSELFEDKLHLSENYSKLRYEADDSWRFGRNNVFNLKNESLIENFIAEIDSAEFIPCARVLDETYFNDMETILYRLYFEMKNGIVERFYFLKGGYVVLEPISDICVKLSDETYKEMLEAFESSQ